MLITARLSNELKWFDLGGLILVEETRYAVAWSEVTVSDAAKVKHRLHAASVTNVNVIQIGYLRMILD